MESPTCRARYSGTPAASSAGVLSPDTLFDVLLRLPGKELCRLRVVCRSWCSLTSDPLFVKAHAARHSSPLFLAKFQDDEAHVHVVDLSGNVLKRLAAADGHHQLLCTNLDLACLVTRWSSCLVLNPATGATYTLPKYPALGDPERRELHKPSTFYAFGRAPYTGEYKVLRMFNRRELRGLDDHQLFGVLTINGGTINARWRGLSRDFFVEARSAAAVDGSVYFLMNSSYYPKKLDVVYSGIPPDYIASFDIEREEWRRELQGPISRSLDINNVDDRNEYISLWHQLTLVELKGSLVLAYYRCSQCIMDLWFLTNFENGLWVKEYSIETESIIQSLSDESCMKPLLLLDDGRLVVYVAPTGQLLICDPQANTCTKVEMRHLESISIYTGSLLSLVRGW